MNTYQINNDRFYYEKRSQNKYAIFNQHYHEHFEIYFLESGSCHYFIDNDTYYVQAGDVVFIPEGIIHKTMYAEQETTRRLIYCASAYIPTAVIPYLPSILYIYRNKKVTERIREIFDIIEQEYLCADKFSEDVLVNHMHLLFFLLARNSDVESPKRTGNIYTTQTISYIRENYAQDIRLSDIAKRYSVSPEHLSRVFKRDTGFGISEYLSTIRLQQAHLLLLSSPSLSVSEVAQRCGFNDSNYFSTKFKQMYGVSPSHTRR